MTQSIIRTIVFYTILSAPVFWAVPESMASSAEGGPTDLFGDTGGTKDILQADDSMHGKQVTLDSAIDIAINNNPEIAAAGYDADMAAARYDQSFTQIMPEIGVTGGYTHDMDEQRLNAPHYNGEPGVFDDNIYSFNIVLTQPLFTGGRLINEIKAARLLKEAAAKQFSRTREELIFNVTSVFYSILAQREIIISLESSEKALNEHLKQVNNLISQKKAALVDRMRTEVRIADISQQLISAENMLSIKTRVLANLMGMGKEAYGLTVTGTLEKSTFITKDIETTLQTALQHRQDYLAVKLAMEASERKVSAARAEHWPMVSLKASYGRRWADDPEEYPAGADKSGNLGWAGIFVNIPVFEGGRISARVREQRAALAKARERVRALEYAIRLDVETSTFNLETAGKRIQATEKAVLQAEESLRIERQKYNFGKGAITDVLDAQSAMLSSRTNYYRALADYNTAIAQLRVATGEKK